MVWHVRWSYVLSKLYGRLRLCHTHFTWHMTDSDSDSWVSDTDSDWVSVTDRLSVSVTDTFIDTVTDGKLLSLLSWKSTGYLLQMFTETATENILPVLFCANQMQWITILFLLLTGRWHPWAIFSDEEEVWLRSKQWACSRDQHEYQTVDHTSENSHVDETRRGPLLHIVWMQ